MSPALRTTLIVIGAALGGILVFVAAAGVYLYSRIYVPAAAGEPIPDVRIIDVAPPIEGEKRFYGAHRYTSGTYDHDRNAMLAAGPGKLTGRITADGKPVQGLKLRLAMNGATFSQWATSGADLDFIEPVKKMAPLGEVSAAKPVIVSWEPYPGATQYKIQLVEQPERRSPMNQKRLFEWTAQPATRATSINLSEQAVELKKGRYYIFEVLALDTAGDLVARSTSEWRHPDFQVVD